MNLITGMAILLCKHQKPTRLLIDVKVTVKYPNQERAEKLMSYIDVQFSEEGNRSDISKNNYR